jgi:hypothetical protein
VFFSLDHVRHRLALWPHILAPGVGLVLKDALRTLAVPVILLAVGVTLLPAPPPTVDGRGVSPVAAPEVERAYRWLIVVALVGTGSLVLAVRWLRGRGRDTPPLVEMPESHVEAEELIEAPRADDARYAPARGRVIRAYLRVLARARQAGFRLEPSLTPREIEGRVRRPEMELRVLTGLFMDARYGPSEPGPEAVVRAEATSREICSTLPARPRRTRLRRPL